MKGRTKSGAMQRRSFLQLVGLAGGGLMMGIGPGGCASVQVRHMESMARDGVGFSPNTFLTITPDDRILLAMNKVEFGQGVSTGMATMVAEELEVPLEKVEALHVSTIPGTTEETRTPVPRVSMARARLSAATACLVAQ